MNDTDITPAAQAVALYLLETWTVVPDFATGATLIRDHDGLTLHLRRDHTGKTRVSLGGIPQEHLRYNEHRPSINVTLTEESARRVARDITRRLLPDADTMNALVAERIAARDAYNDARDALAATLGLDTVVNDGRTRINVGAVWGDATVYDDQVHLDLHNLSGEQAAAIMAILRGAA